MLERLDRALCNMQWVADFKSTTVRHLARLGLDHCPLLISVNDG